MKRSALENPPVGAEEFLKKKPIFNFKLSNNEGYVINFNDVKTWCGENATLKNAVTIAMETPTRMAKTVKKDFQNKSLYAVIFDKIFFCNATLDSVIHDITDEVRDEEYMLLPKDVSFHYANIQCLCSIIYGDGNPLKGRFDLPYNSFSSAKVLRNVAIDKLSNLIALSQEEKEKLKLFFEDVDAIMCSFEDGKPSFYFDESAVFVPELTRVAKIVISPVYIHEEVKFSLRKCSEIEAIYAIQGVVPQYVYTYDKKAVVIDQIMFPIFIDQLLNGEIVERKTEFIEVKEIKLVPHIEPDLAALNFYQSIGICLCKDADWLKFIAKIMTDLDNGFEFSAMALPSWCGKTQTAFSIPVEYKCLYFVMIPEGMQKIYSYFEGVSHTMRYCASLDYKQLRSFVGNPVEQPIINRYVIGKGDLEWYHNTKFKFYTLGLLWICISKYNQMESRDHLPLQTFLEVVANEWAIPCLSFTEFQELVSGNNIDLTSFVIFLDEFPNANQTEFYPSVLGRNILRYLKIKVFVMSTSTGITNITEHSTSRLENSPPVGDIEWCVVARKLKEVCIDFFFLTYPELRHYEMCLASLTSFRLADFIKEQLIRSRPGISFILIKSILSASILLGSEDDPVVISVTSYESITDLNLSRLQAFQIKWFWAFCSLVLDSMARKQLTLYGCISILFPLYDVAELKVEEHLEDIKKQEGFLYPCSNVNGHLFYLGDPYFSRCSTGGFRYEFSCKDTFHLYKNYSTGEIVKKDIFNLDRLSRLYSIPPSWKWEFFAYLYSFTKLQTHLQSSTFTFRNLWYNELYGKTCPPNEKELKHNSGMMAESFAVCLFIMASHIPLRCLLPTGGDRSQMFASRMIPQSQKLGDFFIQILKNCFTLQKVYELSFNSYLESLKIHVPILGPCGRKWPDSLLILNPSLLGNCERHPNSDRCDFSFDIYCEDGALNMHLDKCFFEVKDKESFSSSEFYEILIRLKPKNRLLNLVVCRENSLSISLEKADYDAIRVSDIQDHPFLDEVHKFTTWWDKEKIVFKSVLSLGLKSNYDAWLHFLRTFVAQVEPFVQRRKYITEKYAAKLEALNSAINEGSDNTAAQSEIVKSIANLLKARSSLELIHDIKMCRFNLFVVSHSTSDQRGSVDCLSFEVSNSTNVVILPLLASL